MLISYKIIQIPADVVFVLRGGSSLDLNFRIYGTMFKRSKTSALGASPAFVSEITATGFLNG